MKMFKFAVSRGANELIIGQGFIFRNTFNWAIKVVCLEVAQRCSYEKMWKYAASLQENTHAEEWFQ